MKALLAPFTDAGTPYCYVLVNISWEVELGKLRLRFQCDYFLHNRLIENYIVHLLNALCKGETKAFYDCLLVG